MNELAVVSSARKLTTYLKYFMAIRKEVDERVSISRHSTGVVSRNIHTKKTLRNFVGDGHQAATQHAR